MPRPTWLSDVRQPWRTWTSCSKAEAEANQAQASEGVAPCRGHPCRPGKVRVVSGNGGAAPALSAASALSPLHAPRRTQAHALDARLRLPLCVVTGCWCSPRSRGNALCPPSKAQLLCGFFHGTRHRAACAQRAPYTLTDVLLPGEKALLLPEQPSQGREVLPTLPGPSGEGPT